MDGIAGRPYTLVSFDPSTNVSSHTQDANHRRRDSDAPTNRYRDHIPRKKVIEELPYAAELAGVEGADSLREAVEKHTSDLDLISVGQDWGIKESLDALLKSSMRAKKFSIFRKIRIYFINSVTAHQMCENDLEDYRRYKERSSI